MRLKSFSVKKFRSITRTERIILGPCTVLVGPNNEGKSNILRALVLGMRILTRERYITTLGKRRVVYYRIGDYYDWERDYPINLQEKQKDGKTELILEFEPTAEELEEFTTEIKSRLSGTIPLRIEIGKKDVSVAVHKRGAGSAALSKKTDRIANFIIKKIDFEHIEAVRTANSAVRVVTEMVERELEQLESDDQYVAAIKKIAEIQSPILKRLSSNIKETLSKFLYTVKDVSVSIPEEVRYRTIRRGCKIIIDDGTPTLLQNKGDGAQSLAALGILRHASDRIARSRNLVIAIEEPESHLHPSAIHELKEVLNELSDEHQLLLTTHNPLFVDRRAVCNNIIVKNNKARPAKNINEIREILGIRASDNLRNAEFVLVVEGENDRKAIKALLPERSEYLSSLIENGTMAIDSLAGGTNLSYKLSLLRDSLCIFHAFLDHDAAGKKSYEHARKQGLLTDREVHFSVVPNLREAEIEDLYLLDFYHDVIYNLYGVSLKKKEFKTKKKWSDRVAGCFHASGKDWNDRIEGEIKNHIANLVEQSPRGAVNENYTSLDALIESLEKRLKERESAKKKDVIEE
jgi:predicted ATP-dependent endonuclease of OLD family